MILLSSYPKSGNTWVRSMLTHYYSTGGEVDINDLEMGNHLVNRAIFDETIGVNSADLSLDVINDLRPDYCHAFVAENPDADYCKVHDKFNHTKQGRAIFPNGPIKHVIYLIRNPLNVAPSFANHENKSTRHITKMMANSAFFLGGRNEWGHRQLPQLMGSWSEHVTSWVDQTELPVTVIRYEDLIADTAAAFRKILEAKETNVDQARVQAAVDFCKFDRLQKQEKESGFSEILFSKDLFFQKGAARNWREELGAQEIAKIVEDHGKVMARFGYLPDQ